MNQIEDLFDEMMKKLYDGKVADGQREDMQIGFFTGFAASLGFFESVLPDLPEKEGKFEVFLLKRELNRFFKELELKHDQSTDSNDIPEHMD